MRVKNLIRAYLGEQNAICIYRYIGDANSIGADPDEDYERVLVAYNLKDCEAFWDKEVEYFGTDDNALYLYLVAD
jgi:hypothetical protein